MGYLFVHIIITVAIAVVAALAAVRAIEHGMQAVVMAPTEILAEQHHRKFRNLC